MTTVISGMYKCLHGTAPSYLADELQVGVRRTQLSTVGDRAFPVAAARTWNSLNRDVTSVSSMSVFRGRLKAFLFRRFFLDSLPQLS